MAGSSALCAVLEGLARFCRLIVFDKRGTGLSDPVADVPTLEQRAEDVLAVMDATGSESASLFGISEGGPMSIMFAATHPNRVDSLVLTAQWRDRPRRRITRGRRPSTR